MSHFMEEKTLWSLPYGTPISSCVVNKVIGINVHLVMATLAFGRSQGDSPSRVGERNDRAISPSGGGRDSQVGWGWTVF